MDRRSACRAVLLAAMGQGAKGVALAYNNTPGLPVGGFPLVKSTVLVLVDGGLSHIDSFDPKPRATGGVRSGFPTIQTATPGVHFTEHLPRIATLMPRASLLRCMSHTAVDHDIARHFALTGETQVESGYPGIGNHLAYHYGWKVPPVYVAIPGVMRTRGEYGDGHDVVSVYSAGPGLMRLADRSVGGPGTARWGERELLRRKLIQSRPGEVKNQVVEGVRSRAQDLIESKVYREIIDMESVSSREAAMYGESTFGRFLVVARRFIEAGSRFVVVRLGGFDTHTNNTKTLANLLPRLDAAISGLISDLHDRGLDRECSVVAVSEFGRSPRINADDGRDHWPAVYSALLAGAGVKTGQVIGASDSNGGEPLGDSFGPNDLARTLLHLHGINTEGMLLPRTRARVLPGARLIEDVVLS